MKIEVLGIVYSIKKVGVIDKDTHYLGYTDHVKQEILIDEDLKNDQAFLVLLHEVMHIVFHLLGYSELHEDEVLVQSIASALHQLVLPLSSLRGSL